MVGDHDIDCDPRPTEMLKLELVAEPPKSWVALTATLNDPAAVGVPEITPVSESIDKPAGRAPEAML